MTQRRQFASFNEYKYNKLMQEDFSWHKAPKRSGFWTKTIMVVFFLAVLIAGALVGLKYLNQDKESAIEKSNANANQASEGLAIPPKVAQNKFGFLSGGKDDTIFLSAVAAGWVRPHPGPFLWDAMQKDTSSNYDFSVTDEVVKNFQANNIAILATLWPFVEWDQKNHKDPQNCKVSDKDEFLAKNASPSMGLAGSPQASLPSAQLGINEVNGYLPQSRCNPTDWVSYQKWLAALVDRYNGDGRNDMPGLKIPIKYWEIMNEPDLNADGKSDQLTFYKETPQAYGELLVKSYQAIKSVDSEARVLIAGAAGADEKFLQFYRTALTDNEAAQFFDIGNVHCISNDKGTDDFNVKAYQKMLTDLGVNKQVWVTEAEKFTGNSLEENYQATSLSTKGAIAAGAQKIFFTRTDFGDTRKDMSQPYTPTQQSIDQSTKLYKELIGGL